MQFPGIHPSLSRRNFLKAATAGVTTSVYAARERKRPNLLYILCDEWRAQAMGYNGDTNVVTPALDRLASESVSFDNAISGCPVCCPARASIMTGQYPLTNGVFINDVELKPNAPTLGETFAAAGYQTGYIGKWHLYGSPDGHYGRRLKPVPADKRFGFHYWKACECTHDYNHSLYYEGNDPTPRYWPGYDAFAQTDDACRFMEAHARKSDPFFLFLSMGPPHFPYTTAPDKFRAMYTDRPIALRPNVPESKRTEANSILRGYYAHIAALDTCLERLLTKLEQLHLAEDTIVVFNSDHGDMMLSQGLTTKLYPWDESVRVPFLLRYPRQLGRRGKRIKTPLNTPDIMPTIVSLADLKIPAGVEGSDLSPIAKGHAPEDITRAAFINLPVPITEARRYGFAAYRGLRTARYTYVRSVHGPWLLYDHQADPFQKHNLCNQPSAAKLRTAMEHKLSALLKERKDEFLPAKEYVRRAHVGHYREVNVKLGHVKSPWGDWESTVTEADESV